MLKFFNFRHFYCEFLHPKDVQPVGHFERIHDIDASTRNNGHRRKCHCCSNFWMAGVILSAASNPKFALCWPYWWWFVTIVWIFGKYSTQTFQSLRNMEINFFLGNLSASSYLNSLFELFFVLFSWFDDALIAIIIYSPAFAGLVIALPL